MKTPTSSTKRTALTAHSRSIRRGSLGDFIDGRSREGKFLRRIEAELLAQLGQEPSFGERLLVRRAARAALRLELFDEKFKKGTWSDNDARTFGGLSNNLRLCLRELGLKAAPKDKPLSLDAIVERHHASAK
jgi:hypothetical protein